MVHALQRAGRRLRPGGTLVSIRPHRTWRPAIAITAQGRRLLVARLVNPSFDRNLRYAEAALDRVVRDGWFRLAGLVLDRSNRQDAGIRWVDDRRDLVDVVHPEVRDGEGIAHVILR